LPMTSESSRTTLSKDQSISILKRMILVRHFEQLAEGAYYQGKIGGFFHSSIGQEAIATTAVEAFGKNQWYIATYRVHSIALSLEDNPNSYMAELYGKSSGNTLGRGGSMHFVLDNLLGGFGIVAGHLPIAAGAAFSSKYLNQGKVAICFLGDGASAMGAFYESLNLGTLWELPVIYIIENNSWGMGTSYEKAMSVHPLGEKIAKMFGLKGFELDGMSVRACYEGFSKALEYIKKQTKPIVIEVKTERFRGHSVSDPGLYRSKDELKKAMKQDPIIHFKEQLLKKKWISNEQFEQFNEAAKKRVLEAIEYAEKAPWPDPLYLEEGVFAKETQI